MCAVCVCVCVGGGGGGGEEKRQTTKTEEVCDMLFKGRFKNKTAKNKVEELQVLFANRNQNGESVL